MATSENKQGAADEPSRVHKASEVHKRRASSAPEGASTPLKHPASTGESAPVEPPAQASVPAADVERSEGTPSEQASPSASDEQSAAVQDAGESETPSEAASEVEAGEEAETGAEETRPKKRLWKRVVAIIVCIALAALLVFVGFVAGSRWVRFNDEADIQGQWFAYGTNVPINIEKETIAINENTAYSYHIDSIAKTIEYSFGNLKGQGRYWFNDGRDILIITDGRDYTMWSTLVDDVKYGMSALFGNTDLPKTDDSIVLTRTVVEAPASSEENGGESTSTATSEVTDKRTSETLTVSDIMMDDGEGAEG